MTRGYGCADLRLAVVSPFVDRRHGTERALAEVLERLASNEHCEIHLYAQRVESLSLAQPGAAGSQQIEDPFLVGSTPGNAAPPMSVSRSTSTVSQPRCHTDAVCGYSMRAIRATANRKCVGIFCDQSRRPTQVRDPGPYGKLMIGVGSQEPEPAACLLDQFSA